MVWGLTGGLVAGLVGGRTAELLHLPSRVLLEWLVAVADAAARLPLAPVGAMSVAAAALLVWLAVRTTERRRLALFVAAATALLLPTVAVAAGGPRPLHDDQPAFGLRLWRSGGVTVAVIDGGDPARVLSGLRSRGVVRIDLLVATRSGPRVLAPLAAILDRHDVVMLLGAARLDVAGLSPFLPGSRVRAGPFTVGRTDHGAVEVEHT